MIPVKRLTGLIYLAFDAERNGRTLLRHMVTPDSITRALYEAAKDDKESTDADVDPGDIDIDHGYVNWKRKAWVFLLAKVGRDGTPIAYCARKHVRTSDYPTQPADKREERIRAHPLSGAVYRHDNETLMSYIQK